MAEVKTNDGRLLNVDEATARGLVTMGFATPVKKEVVQKQEKEGSFPKLKVK